MTTRIEIGPAAERNEWLDRWLSERPARRLGLHAGIAALFFLLSIVMTWPLARAPIHHLVSAGDPVFQTWTLAWDYHALFTHPLNVFDANIFYPYHNTLAYSDHLFGQFLVVLPILLTTKNAILADNVSLLLAFAASAYAMYLLVVDLTDNRVAGIIAGFAYAFAPMRMAHLEHLHLVSAEFLPLGVLAMRQALFNPSWRWAALIALVVFLQGLFGVYYLYFLIVLLLLVTVSYLIAYTAGESLITIGQVGLCCAVAVALLLPTLLPYQKVHDELGIERTESEVIQWSATLDNYRAVPPANKLLGDKMGSAHAPDLERELSPGLLLVPLAVAGLFNRRLGWERGMLFAIAAGGIVLSLGPLWVTHGGLHIWLPYKLFYEFVPGFKAIRVPARLALLSIVGIAGLAGLGVDLIWQWLRELRLPDFAERGAVALVALVLLGLLGYTDAMRITLSDRLPASAAEAAAPEYEWMAAHPAPTIEFPMGDGLISSAWPNFWSMYHWNPVVNGYSGFPPPDYYPFRDRMKEFPSLDTIRLLQGMGVRTVVFHARSGTPAEAATLQAIAAFPQLHQVVGAPDYVFTLDEDPWLWDLVNAVPAGQAVTLPDVNGDVPTFGMLAAIFQRQDHKVYGQGSVDYWHLEAAPSGTCYAVLPAAEDPGTTKFPDPVQVGRKGTLALYRDARCGG